MSLFNKKLKLRFLGDEVLLKETSKVALSDIKKKDFQDFLDAMLKTMKIGYGVGLAAPQVGELKSVFVTAPRLNITDDSIEGVPENIFINPEIIQRSSAEVIGLEGCLSIPRIFGEVPRAKSVKVRAYDRKGRQFEVDANDFYARVIQHEYDHLDGVLFFNRMRDLNTLQMEI